MNNETPSQYAVNAAERLFPEIVCGIKNHGWHPAMIQDRAAIIQEHAIDPALVEKDAAIKELIETLKEANACLARFAEAGGRLTQEDWRNTQQLISSTLAGHRGGLIL